MKLKLTKIRPGGLEYCLNRDLQDNNLKLPIIVDAFKDSMGITRLADDRIMKCAASNFKYEVVSSI